MADEMKDNSVNADTSGTATAQVKEADLHWEFEGKSYPLFVANRTGNIGMPVYDPNDKTKKIGILVADFMWQNDQPFLDLLDYDLRDEFVGRDKGITQSKMANTTRLASEFFKATLQRGFWSDINEDGEQGEPQLMTRDQVLTEFAPEVHENLVNLFTNQFFVERYYPSGPPKGRDLLKEPTELFFKCSVGDAENPVHVFIVECDVPTPEARQTFRDNVAARFNENRGDTKIARIQINDDVKLNFIRKRIKSVQGAALGPEGDIDVDDSKVQPIKSGDQIALKNFGQYLNPEWAMRICTELSLAFNFSEK